MSKRAITYVNRLIEEGYVYTMEHAGFSASLMKAPKLSNRDGRPHSLPPGQQMPVIPIGCLPGCPEGWSRDPGTYVCPIDTDWGIWFDFTMNDALNTAVIPSVKGMNPITGRPLTGPYLESYIEKCPVHDEPFSHDRLCEKCGFRWPAQNYLTHESTLWLDGFRQPDGTVRQFFFTEDDKKDIASLVIGKESTMPAFGFVFYEPKEKRREIIRSSRNDMFNCVLNYKGIGGSWTQDTYEMESSDEVHTSYCVDTNYTPSAGGDVTLSSVSCGSTSSSSCSSDRDMRIGSNARSFRSKTASVGAGAEIRQTIKSDGLGLDGWKNEASSIIRLYFCFEGQFRQIVADGGVSGIQTKSSGFLDGLPVG